MGKKKNFRIDPCNAYVQDLDANRPMEPVKGALWEVPFKIVAVLLVVALLCLELMLVLYPFNLLYRKVRENTDTIPVASELDSTAASTETLPENQTAAPAEETCQVTMHVDLNGVVMEAGGTYYVKPLDKITIYAWSSEAGISRIGYFTDINRAIRDTFDNKAYITIPEGESGTRVRLFIEAVGSNDDGSSNTVTKTGWIEYILVYE